MDKKKYITPQTRACVMENILYQSFSVLQKDGTTTQNIGGGPVVETKTLTEKPTEAGLTTQTTGEATDFNLPFELLHRQTQYVRRAKNPTWHAFFMPQRQGRTYGLKHEVQVMSTARH